MKKLILSLLLCLAVLTGCQPGEINETIYFDQIGDNVTDAHKVQDLYVVNLWADSSNISGGGGGNVTGPIASTDNAIVRWNGVLGNALQDYTSNPPTISDTGDMDIDGDIASDSLITNYVDISEAVEPASPAVNNMRMFALDEHGYSVLSYKDAGGMVRQFMRDSVFIAYNDSGSTIAAGRIVYASGSTGTVPEIALAKADSASTMPAIGVTIERLLHGEYGRVMQIGLLEDVNTSAYSAGDVLWVSETTAGIPTATQPTAPHISQEIGTILVDNAVTGAIQIVARSRIGFGVSDNNTVQVDGSPNDDEYARWTAYGLEGRTVANVINDLAVATISQANADIYVDKEATGAGDGTSWTDAYNTIQDAVDSRPDMIIHTHTIHVRHGTKVTGTADSNVLNRLHDTGIFVATTTWAGRRVFNSTDGTWGVIDARVDDDQVDIVDEAGVALDLFPLGNEDYSIEPTPYRETVYLNGAPATYPAKLVAGALEIYAEHYWQDACDANSENGTLYDASANFTDVEVGDMVLVWDRNGANNRTQNYEIGTVNSTAGAGSGNLSTTLTNTPTSNWYYMIVKTEISASTNGQDSGTTYNFQFSGNNIDNVNIYGFICTFADAYAMQVWNCRQWDIRYFYITDCDDGIRGAYYSSVSCRYGFLESDGRCIIAYPSSTIRFYYGVLTTLASQVCIWSRETSVTDIEYTYIDIASYGFFIEKFSSANSFYNTISSNVNTGKMAQENSVVCAYRDTNNAVTPENPVGTTDNPYIE